jgi:hypothetical protein
LNVNKLIEAHYNKYLTKKHLKTLTILSLEFFVFLLLEQ